MKYILVFSSLIFTLILSEHYTSHAKYVVHESGAQIQYGDPGPSPVPDTPQAPGPGEIEDPAQSGETVLGAPDPALGDESVVSEPNPVLEEGDPLVEQPAALVEQPDALLEEPEPLVEQPEALVPQGEPTVEEPEPLGDTEAEGRGIR